MTFINHLNLTDIFFFHIYDDINVSCLVVIFVFFANDNEVLSDNYTILHLVTIFFFQTYIHTYIHILQTYICMHKQIHACVCMYTEKHDYVCMYVCMHVCMLK